ncbi:MAG: GNAT superfamily N-acetyltransferase [Candidatus Azotimanducaceae bacterium]|jgi:GNAT superfamily N-acetyltransferase
MVHHPSPVDGARSSGGRAEAQLGKRWPTQFAAETDRKEMGSEGTDRTDRTCRRVILRHAHDDDAEQLDTLDVGGSSEWLDEVSGIVSGVLAWRSEAAAAPRDRQVVVAVEDGRVVGVTAHERVASSGGRVWSEYRYLMVTAVRADQQRSGLARFLVEAAIAEMRSLGCESVEWLVHPRNRPSIAFSRNVFPEADERQFPEDDPYVSFVLDL